MQERELEGLAECGDNDVVVSPGFFICEMTGCQLHISLPALQMRIGLPTSSDTFPLDITSSLKLSDSY
jgi:hypothetical protein